MMDPHVHSMREACFGEGEGDNMIIMYDSTCVGQALVIHDCPEILLVTGEAVTAARFLPRWEFTSYSSFLLHSCEESC